MFKTVFAKQWPEIRDRIWTYPIAALFFSLFWQESNFGFLVVVGTFLTLDMAVQTAGDDVRWGTFEFIFTRAIDRRKYISLRFLFGLLPLAGLVGIYVVLEFVDIRMIFWNLNSEPLEDFPVSEAINAAHYILISAALFFLFSLVFLFCSAAARESSFSGLLVLGLIVTLLYVAAACALTTLLLHGTLDLDSNSIDEVPVVLVLSAFLLVPALIFLVITREHYGLCQVPATVRGDERSSPWISWVVLALAILLVLFFLYYMLSATRSVDVAGG